MVTWGWGSQVGKLRQEVIKKNLDPGHKNGGGRAGPLLLGSTTVTHQPQLVTLPPAFGKLDHAVIHLEQWLMSYSTSLPAIMSKRKRDSRDIKRND